MPGRAKRRKKRRQFDARYGKAKKLRQLPLFDQEELVVCFIAWVPKTPRTKGEARKNRGPLCWKSGLKCCILE